MYKQNVSECANLLKVIISKVYFNASTKNNVKKSKLVQIWLLLLEELNKINDIFYYNYNEYINENRKIISLDLTNQQLIKYINNGIIKIIDE